MKLSNFVRQHWAAFRALLVLTVITGLAYPLFIWLVAQVPGLSDNANGSIIRTSGCSDQVLRQPTPIHNGNTELCLGRFRCRSLGRFT